MRQEQRNVQESSAGDISTHFGVRFSRIKIAVKRSSSGRLMARQERTYNLWFLLLGTALSGSDDDYSTALIAVSPMGDHERFECAACNRRPQVASGENVAALVRESRDTNQTTNPGLRGCEWDTLASTAEGAEDALREPNKRANYCIGRPCARDGETSTGRLCSV
ncbi:uncharacterized protein MYCFIDRAFT_192495 [Pseudocercospora fijiensis CIRAD86]|uniref:Uncharacterized protein n=1 Tax=Pseudocercospora fijiensis (strain CIRAD86) TaxID=383855 RepID=N1QB47_PSEFD|nr:uncharacterized protein MYCFIDRAFT_192495 [Pseudocercospora fijiensis CIRAD86]EME88288.1 hypothetical protein MYCFIDRAFT_192495 [Pseudocercospora fijiensis CIRAD86]